MVKQRFTFTGVTAPVISVVGELRRTSKTLKTTICIPCVPEHWQSLEAVLMAYKVGTEVPDEVVVSLSDCDKLTSQAIRDLEARYSSVFNFKLIRNSQRLSAAKSRQVASNMALGDILIYQDADDLPHPQRVEILRSLFELNKEAMHVGHPFTMTGEAFQKIGNFLDVPVLPLTSLYRTYLHESLTPNVPVIERLGAFGEWLPNSTHRGRFANGAPAVRKSVFERVQWTDDLKFFKSEDCEFNFAVLMAYNQSFFVDHPVYFYNSK
jgi:glycosyltransferase involved in cell wall biosynthesis